MNTQNNLREIYAISELREMLKGKTRIKTCCKQKDGLTSFERHQIATYFWRERRTSKKGCDRKKLEIFKGRF